MRSFDKLRMTGRVEGLRVTGRGEPVEPKEKDETLMIKVSILQGNAVSLKYIAALIAGSPGMEVVATYSSGREALEGIPTNVPDVFIVDLGLPDISGIDVIRSVREQRIDTEILVITAHDGKDHLFSSLRAGASGYLLKGTAPAVIIKAVEVVAQGASPLSPRMARHLVNEFKENKSTSNTAGLSQREKEVLIGFTKGISERELAEELSLSPHTVHTHAKNIFRKLGANSKIEAVIKARERGII